MTEEKTNIQASNNSNAVGSISVGGDVSGNIHIGNVYSYGSEEDAPLTNEEIENGLSRLAGFLLERAPVMQKQFEEAAKKLRMTLGPDPKSLSPMLRQQYDDGIDRMKLICLEALDVSFQSLCKGENPPPYDSRPPFLGLFAFKPEDSEFFFGRNALTQKLVDRLKEYPFLTIMGASGSGKSSLVMAGIVPALEAEMVYFTPSHTPLRQIQNAKSKAEPDAVFVVDQFEELFTLAQDEAERRRFIEELLAATKTHRVIITMRADFWGEVATYKDLKQIMQEHQELIAPMDSEELHEAVQKQATVVGLRFDPALSESILEDVKGEPGAMPLLQHALWMLWNRRHGLWLKAEEYRAFGGIQHAITVTADEFFEKASPEDRERIRYIFLRLTRLDESGKVSRDTRKRVRINDLLFKDDKLDQTAEIVRQLANARLLTTSSDALKEQEVEVAHEALIRNWSRLRSWLSEDRLALLVQENIHEAASIWEASDNDKDTITHHGGRLEDALHLSKSPRAVLGAVEMKYLDACKNLAGRYGGFIKKTSGPIFLTTLILLVFIIQSLINGVMVTSALSIGFIIPLFTILIFYNLDRYRIVELRWLAFCLLGGAACYVLAAQINPYLIKSGLLTRDQVVKYAGPAVEQFLKGICLYLILSRIKFTRMVDGIIYGLAVAAGFSFTENIEYFLTRVDIAIIIAATRSLSTIPMQMAVTGMAGYLLFVARFEEDKMLRAAKNSLVIIVPTLINSTFNIMVHSFAYLAIAVLFGFACIAPLYIFTRRLINKDQAWVDQFLQGRQVAAGSSPTGNIQRITNIIQDIFGNVRAEQIERFLILLSRHGIMEKYAQDTKDSRLRHSLEEQSALIAKKARGAQAAIGSYCWEHAISLFPELAQLTDNKKVG